MADPLPSALGFEPWLRRLPGFDRARVVTIALAEGGASNLTCRVALEGAPLRGVALRVQRERGIFEPYDVLREGEVVRLLAASGVPVPPLVGSERDPAVLGAPFIVEEWVDAPHMGVAGPDASFAAFTDMVARIHALDWRALGLHVLGVPASPAAATSLLLDEIAARMPAFGCAGDPVLAPALAALRANVPPGGRLALCQGDINVFNYLFRAGQVVAVVDWEQARVADPRTDVGHLLALSLLRGAPFDDVRRAPFLQAYEVAAGARLDAMEYFRALWLFQLGVIYHGWVAFNGTLPWYAWDDLVDSLTHSLAAI